jgi:hypothetical protein
MIVGCFFPILHVGDRGLALVMADLPASVHMHDTHAWYGSFCIVDGLVIAG